MPALIEKPLRSFQGVLRLFLYFKNICYFKSGFSSIQPPLNTNVTKTRLMH